LRMDPSRFLGFTIIVIVSFLLLVLLQQEFTPFGYCQFNIEDMLVSVDGDIGFETGRVLWGNRQLDVIALGFLLFVTAAGCISVLRSRREDQG